jgi:uncharacterized protein YggU (UPF0235/DUF167 family)
MAETPLAHLDQPGTQITVRITPRAARNRITQDGGEIRAHITTPPEDGKANAAAQKLLAKALGVAKSRLTLTRSHTARDKVFTLDWRYLPFGGRV